MKKKFQSHVDKLETIKWAYQLAWKINKKMLIGWNLLSILSSILPAISLMYYRELTEMLSTYIFSGIGQFSDMISSVICYGITLVLIGVSARVNRDLIYMMMYDSYYLGMQELLMDSLQKVEITDLLKRELNDDYNYIVDRAGSLTDIMSGACEIVGKFVSVISLMIVSYSISRMIFGISVIYIILMLILNFNFTEKVRWDTKDFRKISRISSYYEAISYDKDIAKEIRFFGNADSIIRQWKKENIAVKEYERNRYFQIELCDFLASMGFYIFLIATVFYHLFLIAEGELEVSAFVTLFNLCMSIFTAIGGISRAIMMFDYGLYALGRQKTFMKKDLFQDEYCCKDVTETDFKDVFRVENLCFEYQEDVPILKDISFNVKKGEIIALVGENGSGKSTLSKILLGMYKPTAGKMEFCGIPYEKFLPEQIRKRIGVFFQDFFLFHAPIYENIAYGDITSINDEEKIREAVLFGGAEKIVNKLKKGIHTVLGRGVYQEGIELSGGEKQRIAVARAYMNNKDILIFDEPASAVDPIAEAEQFLHIKEKLDGRTAILISHRVGFARMADRILLLHKGSLIEEGTHAELIERDGMYAKFYYEQAKWYEKETINSEE